MALGSDKNSTANDEFEAKLLAKIGEMIRLSDVEEEPRRRNDRLGANIYYGRHWNVPMPKNRAALVINVAKSLVDHKIAIMTKQMPIPVVQPEDAGDVGAAHKMRTVLQSYWREDRMMVKSRNALRMCNTMRTVASKTYWDPDLKGGIGGITTDIIPGYRLILDPHTDNVDRMEFLGDRAWMPRTRAMKMYPHAAEKIRDAAYPGNTVVGISSNDSPAVSPYKPTGGVETASAGGAIINGKPVITAFTGRSVSAATSDNSVEIREIFYRDRSLVDKETQKLDGYGKPEKRIKTTSKGTPSFKQTKEWDAVLGEPAWELETEDIYETKKVPKYPYYRKTVVLYPDNVLIDDDAFDAPHPYELLSDQVSLEGPWDKGCITEVEDLQATVNISASTMLDNLRFSAFRAFKKTSTSNIQKNNLVISPGEIIDVGASQDGLMPLEFPQVSQSWFQWLNFIIGLMERLIGATGVMQGESTGRVDSAQGYDMLAEIGGSRIVECTQRFEEWIGRLNAKVGWYAQRFYTEEHAVRVEDYDGNLTWERAAAPELVGTFTFHVVTGSTLAWNQSSVRQRVIEEFQQGFRDKVSVWQNLGIEDWQQIKKRMETQNPAMNPAPPPRTRQNISSKGGKKNATAKPH